MSSSVVASIRVVSLPIEYQTPQGAIELVENVLQLGKVASVRIVDNSTPNNVRYSSAFVDFENTSADRSDVFAQINQSSQSVSLECDVPIHWTNGRDMTHVAVRRAQIGSGGTARPVPNMPLEIDSWMSIYVPMIPDNMLVSTGNGFTSFGPSDLQWCIEDKLRLGKVKRVDFVTRQQDDRAIQSAFVHFESWYDLPYAAKVRDAMNADGSYRQKGYLDNGAFVSFVAFGDDGPVPRFLTFKINHKPIPEVKPEMNIEQYAAANDRLSKAVAEKDAKIAELEAAMAQFACGVDGKGPMSLQELA
jgi:hypothetical protein